MSTKLKEKECHFEGAKRLRNPMRRIVPNNVRDLLIKGKDPSVCLRRPQDDSIASRISPFGRNDKEISTLSFLT